ncbi:MAG: fibronectin type III domain-containing protein [Bacteroidia bacterium]|nr:fibronectin type III domain-containing protein [Bacteroidia bacterium]
MSWSSAGTKTLTLMVQNNSNPACISTVHTVLVTVHSVPTAVFTATNVCANSSILNVLSNVVYNGVGGSVFTWDCDGCVGGNPSGVGPHQLSWSSVGVKTLTLVVANGSNPVCTSPAHMVLVTVEPAPTSLFNISNPVICHNSAINNVTTTLTFSGTAAPNATYTWTCSGCIGNLNNTAGPYTISWNSTGVKTITLQVTNNSLPICVSSITSALVSVLPTPTSTFTATQICENSATANILSAVSYTGTAANNALYVWSCDGCVGGAPTTQGPHSLSWQTSGTKTLTLAVTNPGVVGCTSPTTSVLVTVLPTPTSTFAANNSCVLSSTTNNLTTLQFQGSASAGATFNWNCNGCIGNLSNTVGPFNISWNSPGTKTVTLQVINNSSPACTSITSVALVTVNPAPTSNFSISANSICVDFSTTNAVTIANFTGVAQNGATYTWNCDNCNGGNPTTPGPIALSWNSAGIKTVTLVVANPGTPTCVSTINTVLVTVNPTPTSQFSLSSNVICAVPSTTNATVTLNYTGQAASSNATYHWTCDGCSGLGVGPGAHTLSWNTVGVKTITLFVVNGGNTACTSPISTQVVTVNTTPTSTFTANSVCDNTSTTNIISTINFTGNASANASYTWNCDGCQGGNPNTVGPHQLSWATPGTKTLTLTVVNNGQPSCTSPTTTVLITVNPTPTGNFTLSATNICSQGSVVNNSTVITYAGSNAGPNAVYHWDCASCITPPTNTVGPHILSWATPGTKTISLYIENPTQPLCTSPIATMSVVVSSTPTSSFIVSSPVCTHNSLVNNFTTVTFVGSAQPGATYIWNCDGCITPPASVVGPHQLSWATPGTKTITLSVVNPGVAGCTSAQSAEIVVCNQTPNPTFIATSAVCQNTSTLNNVATLTYMGTLPIAQYSWDCDGCLGGNPVGGGPHSVSWSVPGTKTVTLVVTTPEGCVASHTNIVTVHPTPVSDFTLSSVVCANDQTPVSFTGTLGNGTTTYTWNCGGCVGGNPNGPGPHYLSWASAGVKTVTLVVNSGGCQPGVTAKTITVHPLPSAKFTATNAVCEGQNATLQFIGTPTNSATYQWDCAGCVQTPLSGIGPHVVSWNFGGNKIVSLLVTNPITGCDSSMSLIVSVIPIPGAPVVYDQHRCGPGVVTFTAQMGLPAGQQLRLFDTPNGGTPIQVQNSSPYTFTIPSLSVTATYYLESYAPAAACSSVRSPVVINIHPIPGLASASTVSRCEPGPVTITPQMSAPMGTHILLYDAPLGSVPIASDGTLPYLLPINFVSTTSTYYLEVINSQTGCTSSSRAAVEVVIHALPDVPSVANLYRCGSGPVTFTASLNNATASEISLFTQSNSNTAIATATSAPFLLGVPNITTTTTFYVGSKNPTTGCISMKVPVVAEVIPLPTSPTANAVSRCGAGVVYLTATMGIIPGNKVYLYTQNIGGVAVDSSSTTFVLQTPYTTTTTTYFIEAKKEPWGCISAQRNSVVVTIHSAIGTATASVVTRCGPGIVTFTGNMGTPAGNAMRLYDQPQGGAVLYQTATTPYLLHTQWVTTSTTFYVTAVDLNTGCESERYPVSVTINPVPGSPAVPPINKCGAGPIAIQAAMTNPMGQEMRLYTQPFGGSAVAIAFAPPYNMIAPPITETTTFYVEAYVPFTGCASLRTPVVVNLHNIPTLPPVVDSYRCGPGVVTFVAGMGSLSGTELRLYESLTSTTPIVVDSQPPFELISPYITTTTTFYISAYDSASGCEGLRKTVVATIYDNIEQPSVAGVVRCGQGTVTFSPILNFVLPSSEMRLYTQPFGGIPVATSSVFPYLLQTPSISNTTTFYIEHFDIATGCFSERVPAIATVNTLLGLPYAENVTRCAEGFVTFSALMGLPAGNSIHLYTSQSATVSIASANQYPFLLEAYVTTTTTFYLESSATNGCVSSRTQVVAFVNNIPVAPVAQNVARCKPGPVTITALAPFIPGHQMRLYSVPFGGIPIAVDETPEYTLTIPYASYTNVYYVAYAGPHWGCESDRVPVTVNIHNTPPAPYVVGAHRCGQGSITFTVNPSSYSSGYVFELYPDISGSSVLTTSVNAPYTLETPTIVATTTFYVATRNTLNGCISDKIPVIAEIRELPGMPLAANVNICGPGVAVFTASMGIPAGSYIRLLDAPNNGFQITSSGLAPYILSTPYITTSTLYFLDVVNQITGCTSAAVPVRANVIRLPEPPSVLPIRVCNPQSVVFTAQNVIAGDIIRLYTQPSGGNPIATSILPPYELRTPLVTFTTTFYVERYENATGCASIRLPVEVMVQNGPDIPFVSEVSRCGSGEVTFTVLNVPALGSVRLYTSEIGGAPIVTDAGEPYLLTTSVSETTNFYISVVDEVTQCESRRVLVRAVVKSLPMPVNIPLFSRCDSGVVNLIIPAYENDLVVKLYTQSTGGLPVSSDNTLPYELKTPYTTRNTQYFVELEKDGCSLERISVNVDILPKPEPPISENVSRCGAGAVVFSVVAAPGHAVHMYRTQQDMMPIATTTLVPYELATEQLVATTTYWLELQNLANGCKGERVPVVAEVRPLPPTPLSADVSRCGEGVVTFTVNPNGAKEIRLYDASNEGVLISSAINSPYEIVSGYNSTTTTYYLTAYDENTNCLGRRIPVVATIHSVPLPPIGQPASICGAGSVRISVMHGSIPGDGVRLYTLPSGGAHIASALNLPVDFQTPFITTTTIFYLESFTLAQNCTSERSAVTVSVIPRPESPIVFSTGRCGAGNISIKVLGVGGNQVRFYEQLYGANVIAQIEGDNTIVTLGPIHNTTTYYAEAYNFSTGCTSERVSVIANVYPVPAPPLPMELRVCGERVVTFLPNLLAPYGNEVKLYAQMYGGTAITTAKGPIFEISTPTITTHTTFYLESSIDSLGCASSRSPIAIEFIQPPMAPESMSSVACANSPAIFRIATLPQSGLSYRLYNQITGGDIVANVAFAPYNLVAPLVSSNTTFYLEAYHSFTNCASRRVPVEVRVFEQPALPIATDITICKPSSVVITAHMQAPYGSEIRLYTEPMSSTPMLIDDAAPFELETPFITTNTAFYISSYNAISGCESEKKAVRIQFLPELSAPQVQNVIHCGAGSVIFTINAPAGETVRLYSDKNANIPLDEDNSVEYTLSTPYITTTTIFYVERNKDNFCPSSRVPVIVTIEPSLIAPTVRDISVCGAQTVTFTVQSSYASNIKVQLFTSPLAQAPIAQDSIYPYIFEIDVNSTTQYYVRLASLTSNCNSPFSSLQITVHSLPQMPASSNVAICGSGSVTFTAASNGSDGVRLYTQSIGGEPISVSASKPYLLMTPTITTTTTFYLEAFVIGTGCNTSPRVPVIAQVHPAPAVPRVQDSYRCGSGKLTFTVTSFGGNITKLYLDVAGGTPIDVDIPSDQFLITPFITTNTTFYIASVDTMFKPSCESPRVAVRATIFPLPAIPNFEPVVRCGPGSVELKFSTIQEVGTTIRLYSTSSAPNYFWADDVAPYRYFLPYLSTSTTYYAEVYNNVTGCSSARKEVPLTILQLPAPPNAIEATRCGPGTITLTITYPSPNYSLLLYESSEGGIPKYRSDIAPYLFELRVGDSPATWYAAVRNESCESERVPIKITPLPLPSTPILQPLSRCGKGSFIIEPTNLDPSGIEVLLYTIPGEDFILKDNYPPYQLVTPEVFTHSTYYVAARSLVTGCSTPLVPVSLEIELTPPVPYVAEVIRCGIGSVVFSLSHTLPVGLQASLYVSNTGGQPLTQTLQYPYELTTPMITTTTTFYVEVSRNRCSSTRTAAIARVVPQPGVPSVTSVRRCGAGDITFTAFMGNPAGQEFHLFDSPTGGNLIAKAPANNGFLTLTNIATTTTYYLASVVPGSFCESERTPAVALIHNPPILPIVESVYRCGPGNASFTVYAPTSLAIKLYTQPTGGNPLITTLNGSPYYLPLSNISTNTTFYITTQELGTNCESERVSANIIIHDLPGAPPAGNVTLCEPSRLTLTISTILPAGWAVRLYDSAVSQNVITSDNVLPYELITPLVSTHTEFYVSIINPQTGCESNRSKYWVYVHSKPNTPTVPSVSRCGIGNIELMVSGVTVNQQVFIYDSPFAEAPIHKLTQVPWVYNTDIATTSRYYIRTFDPATGCLSSPVEAIAEVLPVPEPPIARSVSRCGIGQLTITPVLLNQFGLGVRLYTQAIGSSALAQSELPPYHIQTPWLTTHTTLWIASYDKTGGCESPRVPVAVGIHSMPDAPIVQGVNRCGPGTVVFSTSLAPGNAFVGYLNISTTVPFGTDNSAPYELTTPEISSTTTFFFQAVNLASGCSSHRVSATAEVLNLPSAPQAADIQICTPGVVTLTVYQSNPSTTRAFLLDNAYMPIVSGIGSETLLTTPLVTTTTTFYLQAVHPVTNCSSNFASVVVKVLDKIVPPRIADVSRCGAGPITLTAIVGAGNFELRLYDSAEATDYLLSLSREPFVFSIPHVQSSTTYYLEAFNPITGCSSTRAAAVITIHPQPFIETINSAGSGCKNSILQLEAVVHNATSIIWSGPNGFTSTSASIALNLSSREAAGVYTVVASNANCNSQSYTFPVNPITVTSPVISFRGSPSPTLRICEGENIYLKVENDLSFPAGTTFIWHGPIHYKVKDVPHDTIFNAQTINEGYYYLTAIVNGCTSDYSNELLVYVAKKPEPPVARNLGPYCLGRDSIRIFATTVPDALIYKWYGPNNQIVEGQSLRLPNIMSNAGVWKVEVITRTGCTTSTAATNVIIYPIPQPPALITRNEICSGEQLKIRASGAQGARYIWRGPNGLNITTTSDSLVINSASLAQAGSYSAAVIVNGCTSQFSRIGVAVKPTPVVSALRTNAPLCSGSDLVLTAFATENAVLLWQGPNNYTHITSDNSITIPAATSLNGGNYRVWAIMDGCTSTVNGVDVQIYPIPNRPSIGGDTSVCVGSQLLFAVPIEPNTQYYWKMPNQEIIRSTALSLSDVQLNASGTYEVYAYANGCTSAPARVHIQVNPIPAPPVLRGKNTYCVGETLSFSTVPQPRTQYWWQGPAGFVAEGIRIEIPDISPIYAGNYTVYAISRGCTSAPSTITAEVLPLPGRPSLFSNSPVCAGSNLNITANVVAQATYVWQGPNGFSSTSLSNILSITNVNFAHAGTYTLVVVVNGCTSLPATINVNILGLPVQPTIFTNSPICTGQTLSLSTIPQAGVTYSWRGPNGFVASGAQVSRFAANTTISGIYELIARAGSCSSTAVSVRVVVNETPPAPSISSNAPICQGQELKLSAGAQSAATYIWSGPDNFAAQGALVSRVITSSVQAGVYSVIAVANGCTSEMTTLDVEVTTFPELQPSSNAPLCIGQTLNLTAQFIPGAAYYWVGPDFFVSNMRMPKVFNMTPAKAGVYTVVAILNGCTSAPEFVNVQVLPQPPMPGISTNEPVCQGSSLHLSGSSIQGANYYWSGPNGFTAFTQSVTINNVTSSAEGYYTLYAVVGSCTTVTNSKFITIHPTPAAPVVSSNSPICEGNSVVLNATYVQGASYLWKGPNGFVSTQQNPAPFPAIGALAGEYTLVTIQGNCTSQQVTTNIQVLNRPSRPNIAAPRAVCQNGELILRAFAESGASYYWSGPENFTATTQQVTPSISSLQGSQAYSVVAVLNGCTSAPAVANVDILIAPQNLAVSSNAPICEGSTLVLTATATASPTYTWQGPAGFAVTQVSPQIVNIRTSQAGIYTVTAQIGACSVQRTVEVLVYPQPQAVIINQKNATCTPGEVELRAQSGQQLLYSINEGPFSNTSGLFRGLAPGNYLIRYTNGQCTTAVPITITDNSVPSITQIQPALQAHSMLSVSWEAVNGALGYNLSYRKAGSNEPWQTINDIPSTSYVITGLASNAVYEFRVQSICGVRNFSPFSPIRTGITEREPQEQPCPAPSSINVELVNSSSARVLWTPVLSGVTCYVISYGSLSNSPDSWNTLLVPHPSSSLLLENLQAGVTYGVTIRSNCTNCSARNGVLSNWLAPRTFTPLNTKAESFVSQEFDAVLYPNPTSGNSQISITTSNIQNSITIEIFTITGTLVYHKNVFPTSTLVEEYIDLEDKPAGIYWVRITQGSVEKREKLILR